MRFLLVPVLLLSACQHESPGAPPDGSAPPPQGRGGIVALFGPDVPPGVRDRVATLLTQVDPHVATLTDVNPEGLLPEALVLSFGDTVVTRALVEPQEVHALGP